MDSQIQILGETYIKNSFGNLESITNSFKELLLEAYIKGFKDASTLAYMKIHKNKNNEIK